MVTRRRVYGAAFALLLLVGVSTAVAQEQIDVLSSAQTQQSTPDGSTPAAETVCDGLEGVQFGLCNAYCEAMDCDSPSPNANATACNRVRERFLEAGGDEIRLACGCPCDFSSESLEMHFGTVGVEFCFNVSPATGSTREGYALVNNAALGGGQTVAVLEFNDVFNTPSSLIHPSCGLQAPFDPTRPQDYVGGLTIDQAIACRTQLLAFEPCDCGSTVCVLP